MRNNVLVIGSRKHLIPAKCNLNGYKNRVQWNSEEKKKSTIN